MKGNLLNTIQNRIQGYVNTTTFSKEDGLPYWRERIFNGLVLVFLIFGTVAIIPNLIASIYAQTHLLTISDVIVYTATVIIFFGRNIPLRIKIHATLFLIYLLSITLLITLGPFGPGFVWLASTSLIAALLLGMRASIFTIGINTGIIIVLALLIHFGSINTIFFTSYTFITWIAVSMNIIIFNSLSSIPLALLIEALEKSLLNETKLKTELLVQNNIIENEKIEAQNSDRLKSTFLANLSHEIRTPMNAIVGFSEMINKEIKDNNKVKTYIKHVIQNSQYLLNLISDIVDISLIESGQISFRYKKSTVAQLIEEVKPTIEASTARKKRPHLVIKYTVMPSLKNLEIPIDITRVKQILINLIINALKYTPEGSVIIAVKHRGEFILFSVIDSGVGIPLAEQQKIYTRFSKIDRKGNFSMPGIGLGLSITKGLCEAMGGKIWFESKEKAGTTFHFTLPFNQL